MSTATTPDSPTVVEQIQTAVDVVRQRRQELNTLPERRCGRPRPHRRHAWVPHPKSEIDYDCDGRVYTTSLAQLRSELAAMCA